MKISEMLYRVYIQPALGCFLRAEEGMAKAAAGTAAGVGAQLGTTAATEGAQLNPFMSREMQAEHMFDPTQLNELLTHAGLGAGAGAGALETSMERQAATTGNAAAGAKSLDELARDRTKAAAGASEGIAAQDVMGAQQLRQEGAGGMMGLYGENLKGQLAAMGQESADINAATNASKTGYLQDIEGLGETGADIAKAYKA
jgi:hypothetical protein